jgi:hypothetical protein
MVIYLRELCKFFQSLLQKLQPQVPAGPTSNVEEPAVCGNPGAQGELKYTKPAAAHTQAQGCRVVTSVSWIGLLACLFVFKRNQKATPLNEICPSSNVRISYRRFHQCMDAHSRSADRI